MFLSAFKYSKKQREAYGYTWFTVGELELKLLVSKYIFGAKARAFNIKFFKWNQSLELSVSDFFKAGARS